MCPRRGILGGWNMFNALDTIHATATELDEIQTCFLGLGAPVFAKSLAQLLNLQLYPSLQFQLSGNRHLFALFQDRPPARTSRLPPHINHVCFIRAIVPLSYLPLPPPSSLTLADQYAFRPTGSTTAALTSIFHPVTRLLACNN